MPGPAGLWSDWAIQQLLPRRARKNRSARVRRGTSNIAVPAPPAAAVQAARLPEKAVLVVVVLLAFIFSEIPNPRFLRVRAPYCLTICLRSPIPCDPMFLLGYRVPSLRSGFRISG